MPNFIRDFDPEDTAYLLDEVEDLINRIDDIIDNEDAIQYSDDDIYYSEVLMKTIGEIMNDVTLDNFAYERGEM